MKKTSLTLLVSGIACLVFAMLIPGPNMSFRIGWPGFSMDWPHFASKVSSTKPKPSPGTYKSYSKHHQKLSLAQSIDLELDNMDIDICATDEDSIYISYQLKAKSSKDPIRIVEGEELSIEVEDNTNIKEASFTLYLPRQRYQEISIEADMSDITMRDVEMNELSIDADMSNIDISATTFEFGSIDSDMSSINIKDMKDYGLDINADMSSVTVDGQTVSETYTRAGTRRLEINASMEDVNIE